MQYDRLGPDHASVIRNREVFLHNIISMVDSLGMLMVVHITELSLICRAVI